MAAVRETLHFIGQFATRFRQTGAVVPSGGPLARAMVNAIGALPADAVIIELGPGTGVFTRELQRRFPGHRIIAVEANPAFAQMLRTRMPGIDIISGCASRLPQHLTDLGIGAGRVGAILSGVPLLSLPKDLSNGIFSAIIDVLPVGRRYVQFTYSKRAWRRFSPSGLRLDPPRTVLWNVPPAVVMPFMRVAHALADRNE